MARLIDPRVDAYVAHAAPFAQPILERLRADVHAACPDAEEAIKWGMPFFMHAGRNLAHMAAFKAHCAFGFEHGRAVVDLGREAQAMGQFGRITKLDDLPSSADVRRWVKKAMALIDAGEKPPRAPKAGMRVGSRPAAARTRVANGSGAAAPKPAAALPLPNALPASELPAALAEALARHAAAKRFFTTLAPSHRRDYIEWITQAKRSDTRARRVAQAVAWLAEGKRRNWKYERR
ncbi:MAG: YdeI/OmpD-associated family protein [Rubrivivax sp.]|nr:YdeI/OmpD-associated family protein [Rubrivivax sp.]